MYSQCELKFRSITVDLFLSSSFFQVILGKVVCTVIPESGIPFSMCLVDKEGSCIGVTVYNWASGCGVKIGDSVAVIAPVLKTHQIEIPAKEVSCFVCVFKAGF